MGLFAGLVNPVGWIETIADERMKRAATALAMSLAYSQYITFLYELGTGLEGRRLVGWLGKTFIRMAASAFKLLQLEDSQKLIYLSVPAALVRDMKLLDSIWWEEKKLKG